MKQILTTKVLKRIFILFVLSISFGFIVFSGGQTQTVQAAPCCEDCDAAWNQCMSDCTPGDWSCFFDCSEQNNDCSSHCIMCGTGGGGGGTTGCVTDNECPTVVGPHGNFGRCVGGSCVY